VIGASRDGLKIGSILYLYMTERFNEPEAQGVSKSADRSASLHWQMSPRKMPHGFETGTRYDNPMGSVRELV
jgi:hypothetical protein